MEKQTLRQLEQTLRDNGKFWMYESRIVGDLSDEQKREIAEQVLAAQKPWSQGVLEDFNSRTYPPGCNEDEDD